MDDIRQTLLDSFQTNGSGSELEVHFADVKCSSLDLSSHHDNVAKGGEQVASAESGNSENMAEARHHIGGLFWELPRERRMEDCSLFWIGSENSAFANVVLTFNGCEIGACIGMFYIEFILLATMLNIILLPFLLMTTCSLSDDPFGSGSSLQQSCSTLNFKLRA